MKSPDRPALSFAFVLGLSFMLAAGCGGAVDQDAEETPAAGREEIPIPPEVTELSNTFESVYALGEAIVAGVRAGDFETLWSYRIDESEWYHLVWPALPASQPGRNLPWEYAWRDLNQKSRNQLLQTIAAFQDQDFRLVRVEFRDETSDYGGYKVHRDARCVVERADGEIVTLDLFGSVIERRGRFKAFSYVVD